MKHPRRNPRTTTWRRKLALIVTALAITPGISVVSQSAAPEPAEAAARSSEGWAYNKPRLIGFNWADSRDNFQSGILTLSGLPLVDTDTSHWEAAAAKIVDVAKEASPKTNTIRIPINYMTARTSQYIPWRAAVQALRSKGVYVIICYWPDGRGPLDVPNPYVDETKWVDAWQRVFTDFVDDSGVYFEPVNEPYGYSNHESDGLWDRGNLDRLKVIYRQWIKGMSDAYNTAKGTHRTDLDVLEKHRIILAGGMIEQDIIDLADNDEFDDYLLGFHMYDFVWERQHGNLLAGECDACATGVPRNLTSASWARYLAYLIGNHWPRVVITEFGETASKTGYDNPDIVGTSSTVSSSVIPYMQGMADYAYTFGAGMIYWPGFRGAYNPEGGNIKEDQQDDVTPTTRQKLVVDGYNMFSSKTEASPGSNKNSRWELWSPEPQNAGMLKLFNKAAGANPNLGAFQAASFFGCTPISLRSFAGRGGSLSSRNGWASVKYGQNDEVLQLCENRAHDGNYQILNGEGKALEVYHESKELGEGLDWYAPVGANQPNDGGNQSWLPVFSALQDGAYVYLINSRSGHIADVRGDPSFNDSDWHDLNQWFVQGGKAKQRWALKWLDREQPTNLAKSKTATQSSTYPAGGAKNAVDGRVDGVWTNYSVSHTNSESNPWWKVDLGSTQKIGEIEIWNRIDCCTDRLSGYKVEVLDEDGKAVWSVTPGSYPKPKGVVNAGGASGRYVRISLSGSNRILSLAEVRVRPYTAPNLALGKTATQSSTFDGAVAGLAVDGDTDGGFFWGSVTHTGKDAAPWWKVDLGSDQRIGKIEIWNRTDGSSGRLSGYEVEVLDAAGKQVFYDFPSGTPSPNATTDTEGVTGRYVRISLPGKSEYLSLAEVKVFEGPPEASPVWPRVELTQTGGVENFALGMPVTQSSTFTNTGGVNPAVDGVTNGDLAQGSVARTKRERTPWWKVDLGFDRVIGDIEVWNRTDCCGLALGGYQIEAWSDDGKLVWSASPDRPDPNKTISTGGVAARYVKILIPDGGTYLALAEVKVLAMQGSRKGLPPDLDDLAFGQPAVQSSTSGSSTADRATDGKTNGNPADGSVSQTNVESDPWWMVDLGQNRTIREISFWNRTDCCTDRTEGFKVQVRDNDGKLVLNTWPGPMAPDSRLYTGRIIGRYVKVLVPGANRQLSLAEVRVASDDVTRNLVEGIRVSQSSTLGSAAASRAADGSVNGDLAAGSVSQTRVESDPWWKVDLGGEYSVTEVEVWNRTDCCSAQLKGMRMQVLDGAEKVVEDQVMPITPDPSALFWVKSKKGRYVKIYLPGANRQLALAEVKVRGTT